MYVVCSCVRACMCFASVVELHGQKLNLNISSSMLNVKIFIICLFSDDIIFTNIN